MDYEKLFMVPPGDQVRLADRDPAAAPGADKKTAAALLAENIVVITALQYRLYAENRRSLLMVLQGMDAGGKDGVVRHVFAPLNPQGCRVVSFKVPSEVEAAHDFLWRCHLAAPRRGEVVIFNRSHYEDVLVTRVHGAVSAGRCRRRFEYINSFENFLIAEADTTIVKIFLHISPEEQLERLKKRVDDPARQWKISLADFNERQYWNNYRQAYEEVLEHCGTPEAPWYVIPADKKWFRDLAVSSIIRRTMEAMNIEMPPPSPDLDEVRRLLAEPEKKS